MESPAKQVTMYSLVLQEGVPIEIQASEYYCPLPLIIWENELSSTERADSYAYCIGQTNVSQR